MIRASKNSSLRKRQSKPAPIFTSSKRIQARRWGFGGGGDGGGGPGGGPGFGPGFGPGPGDSCGYDVMPDV
jgi:hypothetical protein